MGSCGRIIYHKEVRGKHGEAKGKLTRLGSCNKILATGGGHWVRLYNRMGDTLKMEKLRVKMKSKMSKLMGGMWMVWRLIWPILR